jgi:pyruvate dehydrogenase E2 component (dihydrolipoamide acetyltransferase)
MSSLPEHEVLSMPGLSPTMTMGNLVKYHVKVGDKVSPGDMLCDIETDKATIGWESQEDGYVAALLVPEVWNSPPPLGASCRRASVRGVH